MSRRAEDPLAHAVAVADLDAWSRRLSGHWLSPFLTFRIRSALRVGARLEGFAISFDGPRTTLSLQGELDPVGARVAVLQRAWLRLHGVSVSDLAALSRAEVAARYLDARAAPRRAPRLALVLVPLVLVGTGLAVWAATRSESPPDASGPAVPFDDETETEWVEAITDWVVALDQRNRKRAAGALSGPMQEAEDALAVHRAAALSPKLAARVGEQTLDALRLVFDTGELASLGGDDWETHEEGFATAVRDLNRALSRGLKPYFFDAWSARDEEGRGAEVGLFIFRVVSRSRFSNDDEVIDALHLRRLDRLNLIQFLLGYTSKRMDVAVVLLDKLESELSTRLGPALAPSAEMPLHLPEDSASDEALWKSLKERCGRDVREAFYAAIPSQQQAFADVGHALAARVELVAAHNERHASRGLKLRDFETFNVTGALRDSFAELTSPEAASSLDALQNLLETPENQRLLSRMLARHAATVEQHEVQHRIDYADETFAPPSALFALLGIDKDSDLANAPETLRIAYELSAYTAELARDPDWAKVNLALLAEHLYDGSGGAEGVSAILILEGLAERLAMSDFHLERPVAPTAAARLHFRLLDHPGEALARAAAELWQTWFGKPLPPLLRLDSPPPARAPAQN